MEKVYEDFAENNPVTRKAKATIEEAAERIRGRSGPNPATTPPRGAASSFRRRTGSLPSGGFDSPTPTEGPFCSAHTRPSENRILTAPCNFVQSEELRSASPNREPAVRRLRFS